MKTCLALILMTTAAQASLVPISPILPGLPIREPAAPAPCGAVTACPPADPVAL